MFVHFNKMQDIPPSFEQRVSLVSNDSLAKALEYFKQRNYGRSFAHFLVFFELCPEKKYDYEATFTFALNNFGIELEEKNEVENLCKIYIQGMNYFPDNLFVLNNFARHLIRIEEPDAAKRYLKIAYDLNKTFLPTQKHLLVANLMQVPRWHFKMLNDINRNTAYKEAISNALKKNVDRVLDIGCGCGLLSLFASQCPKVKKIYAIEASKCLCKIARNVFDANKAKVDLINSHSIQLEGDRARGNLIVTEIFDAALFGEHMLDTVIHAIGSLVEEEFEVIPCGATVYVTGISSKQLLRLHQVCYDFPEIMVEGRSVQDAEPYLVEDLTKFDVDYLTETKPIVSVDFKDVATLRKFAQHVGVQVDLSVTLKSLKNGSIEAIAVWFDLYLDETVKLTTNPFETNRAKCWEQAIFYLNTPKVITENEEIVISGTLLENKLQLFIAEASADDTATNFPVSQEIVSFLNDELLMNQIKEMASHFNGKTESYVMDFNPVPVFGILMAKQGGSLFCQAKCDADKAFLEHLAHANKLKRMEILTYNQVFYVRESLRPLDFVFLPPISTDGSADESNLGVLSVYPRSLKGNGIHLTRSVNLFFKIIYSESLENWNRVHDKNVCGFKVGEFFKEFEATEHACIDYKTFQYKQLTETVCAGNLLEKSDQNNISHFDVPIKEAGMANAILYWYQFIYFNGSVFDTRESSHYRCAAFLFPEPKCLTEKSIQVVMRHNDDCFTLSLVDSELSSK